ncbi:MAG: zinc-dependent metalloprotease, partial [Cytophagales bacterium]|nr:zinc-dependent metalloprotease [Cytophagales bacterium]
GNSTTGITRHSTTVDGFDVYLDDVKLKSYGYWPSDKYLNIWVATLTGFLGYAQFPDNTGLPGLDPTYSTASTDGVAINYRYFGYKTGTIVSTKYNMGRTATHEIGHWLGLKHTWGDENDCSGDDYCSDTPGCSGQYFSSFTNSCPSPIQCGSNARQVRNYLDYSDDGCMNLFTRDQKTRMRTTLSVSPRRKSLKYSNGCSGTSSIIPEVLDSTVKYYPNPMDNSLTVEALKPTEFKIYDINGHLVYQNTVPVGINQLDLNFASGVYVVEAEGKRSKLMVK